MHRLSSIQSPAAIERAQPSSGSVSLTKRSGISPSDGMACLLLMKQTKDRYIKQQLPERTAEMYLAEWEEMAIRYGLVLFRDALSRVIRDRGRPQFFPEPDEIERECQAAERAARGRAAVKAHDAMKARWEREREEDLARGLSRSADPKREPERRAPEPVHSEAEIAAHLAATTTAGEREAVRERMRALLAQPEVVEVG